MTDDLQKSVLPPILVSKEIFSGQRPGALKYLRNLLPAHIEQEGHASIMLVTVALVVGRAFYMSAFDDSQDETISFPIPRYFRSHAFGQLSSKETFL